MTNLFNSAGRSIVGLAGALVISLTFLAASAGPSLVQPAMTTPVATLSA